MNLHLLSNKELLCQLTLLRSQERATQVLFLRHLAEVDKRRLYADEGYSSLFRYVTRVLGYSESSALKRIQVARASQRYPQILVPLELGKISLSVLSKICPQLETANVSELLESCYGLSVRSVEKLIAPDSANDLPDVIKTHSKVTSRIQFTASEAFVEKLDLAKALLSAKYPDAKLEDIFNDALDLLIDAKTPQSVVKRASRHASKHARHIPVAVQAEVWQRCEGKCSFISESGHACEERAFLEYDHVIPWAMGGSSQDSSNIRLLCRTHNLLVAEEFYGTQFIAEKITKKGKTFEDELHMNRVMLDLWSAGGWTNAKLATRREDLETKTGLPL